MKEYSLEEKQLLIEIAIDISVRAHRGQRDKADKAYILHPLYIAHYMPTAFTGIVAMLHDTVEDGHVTYDYLRDRGIPEECIVAINLLTRPDDISYDEYIDKICQSKNWMALTVKQMDIQHNLDMSRNTEVTPKNVERINKYIRALKKIKLALRNINTEIYGE